MPTHSDLDEIAKALYPNQTINSWGSTYNLTYTTGTATSLGLPEPFFYLWSGEEGNSIYAGYRTFNTMYSFWGYDGNDRSSGAQAVCVGE